MQITYGKCDQLSPLVRRVICNNPGPFTFKGTGTYIIGNSHKDAKVAVIDPGPVDETHLEALLTALKGQTVSHILVTHTHSDHSPLSRRLSRACGNAPILAAALPKNEMSAIPLDEGNDDHFIPDVILNDGDVIFGEGWTLETITTPGHASNHITFALNEENSLFSGDHIMGWSSTIVAPPDGDMADYIASLDKIILRKFSTIWPTHGPEITNTVPFLHEYRAHRIKREEQIVDILKHGEAKISLIVSEIYKNIDKRLWPAASLSVLAHLFKLLKEGHVKAEPTADLNASWSLI